MGKILDLSQSIVEDGYNNPAFADGRIEICMDYDTEGWHAEVYTAATHVGTHIDAPMHRLRGGIPLSDFPLSRFTGRAVVFDFRGKEEDEPILREELTAKEIREGDFVILFTGWDRYRTEVTKEKYLSHSPFLSADGAAYLAEKKIGMVLIDHYSIGGSTGSVEITHETLMHAQILIGEGLRRPEEILSDGPWTIFAFPMKLHDCSGAPVRIVAMNE